MSSYDWQSEQRSSVKLSMNAKGEAQVECKVYDTDAADDELTARMDRIREQAVRTYNETVKAVRGGAKS